MRRFKAIVQRVKNADCTACGAEGVDVVYVSRLRRDRDAVATAALCIDCTRMFNSALQPDLDDIENCPFCWSGMGITADGKCVDCNAVDEVRVLS